jgi:NhaA family Na+:H+ antiporter
MSYPTKARVFVVIERFLAQEAHSGVFLFGAALAAMIWANSPWSGTYSELWHTRLGLELGQHVADLSLIHWINDALMAVFFLLIGLEIKRELLVGELSSLRKAAFPVLAAAGGMVLPALIYFGVNLQSGGSTHGFGIPMATDIAFVLGFLLILGSRVPLPLKVFITSLAVIDDLGAIIIIALFYSSSIELAYLGYAIIPLAALILLNLGGIRKLWPYLLAGVALWIMFELSGIHATIAGVLLALTVPVRSRIDPDQFLEICRAELAAFNEREPERTSILLTSEQQDALEEVEDAYGAVQNPLVRLQHHLHPVSAFLVIPLFALANAGVQVSGSQISFLSPANLGITLGLVIGKPTGIIAFTYLADRLGWARKPRELSWSHIVGAGILAGVGFTMSVFIAHLAFSEPTAIAAAKLTILICSLAMGILGTLSLLWASRKSRPNCRKP